VALPNRTAERLRALSDLAHKSAEDQDAIMKELRDTLAWCEGLMKESKMGVGS
jgi:hypothetical protein